MDRKVVKELNAYLKGEYMAIKAYENFIERIKDSDVKEQLKNIRGDHERHAEKVSERIRGLGGKPVEGPGFMGLMSDMKNMMKRNSEATQSILLDAGKGEHRGIRMAEEVVKGDLDEESLRLVKSLLEEDRGHVERIGGLLH